jgi:hypothetical protein
MAPNAFIPDLNESSSRGTVPSFNDRATCGAFRQSPKPKRSITFSPFVKFRNVLHINDYSDEELARARYDADELAAIKKTDVIYTLSMMKGETPVDNPWYCGRGLESFTREGSTIKRANKENAWDAVFDEQETQWELDFCDPQAIANAYSEFSRDCQDAAVMKAIQQDQDMSLAASLKLKGGGASPFYRRLVGDDCRREVSSKAA